METEQNLIQDLQKDGKMNPTVFVIVILVIIAVGIGVGYLTVGNGKIVRNSSPSSLQSSSATKTSGVFDKKKFPDNAIGILKTGGTNGEGNFHLERPGGDSQNVYLTSSIVDLAQYVGKKIKVWGETQKAQKAGWLMDVGYIEVQ